MEVQNHDTDQALRLVSSLSTKILSMKIATMKIETMKSHQIETTILLSTCASEDQTVRLVHDSWKV